MTRSLLASSLIAGLIGAGLTVRGRETLVALSIAGVLLGLVLLVAGGEWLVRGASSLALRWGMSPLLVGLTVVSLATGAPELAVSVSAALRDQAGLTVGNVVGSNIANVLLVLGSCAIVAPLSVHRQSVRLDLPVALLASGLLWFFAADHRVSPVEGGVLIAVVVAHVLLAVRSSKSDPPAPQDATDSTPDTPSSGSAWASAGWVTLGVAALVGGAEVLVRGATTIAGQLGVSDVVVGLTVVAIGTSLPELATSVIAVRRGQTDLAIGNIVGSNIVNLGVVLGLPALLIGRGGLPVSSGLVRFDIPVMVAAMAFLFPIVWPKLRVTRWEGVVLVSLYLLYLTNLVLAASRADALSARGVTVLIVVSVLAALTLMALTAMAWHRRRRPSP